MDDSNRRRLEHLVKRLDQIDRHLSQDTEEAIEQFVAHRQYLQDAIGSLPDRLGHDEEHFR
jgi:predicted transcriptional regulator